MPKIQIITTGYCESCQRVKNIVKENNLSDIEFLEYPDNPQAKQIVEDLHIASVPTAIIEGKPHQIEIDNQKKELLFAKTI